jgi:hypothetical protein
MLASTLGPAANASFTSAGQASTSYSAATIPVPAAGSFPVSASCTKLTGLFTVSITVTGTAAVQYANYLELVVLDPYGAVQFTGDLGSQSGRTYSAVVGNSAGHGTWTYEIFAKYKVPNSTNIWTGQPLARNLTCN